VLLAEFRTVAIPVVTWEKDIYDDMDLTTVQGTQNKQTQVAIVDSGHAMAAGLSGTVTVYAPQDYTTWGTPTANADVVATVPGDGAKATLFGYEVAAVMANGYAAPARRVGVFLDADSAGKLTTDGTSLIDAALSWAVAAPPNQAPTADAGPDQNVTDNDENGTEDVTLDGSASSDADGTIVSYEWEEASVPLATGVGPTVTLDVAVHTIDLTVTDDDTATDSDTVVITVSAPGSGSGPVVVDLSGAFNMDAFCGPKEFQECKTANQDLAQLYGDQIDGSGNFIRGQYHHIVGNSTGTDFAYSITGDAGHPVNLGGTQGVPIDGVLTGGDGRTYHMGSVGGNSTLPGDWTEVADPSTYLNKPDCIYVGSTHNIATFQVAAVTAELPAGQKGEYLNVNFVLAAANVADKARNMRIVALYGDGTDTEILYSFSTADGGDGPLMIDADGGATFSAVYTSTKYYNGPTGTTGAVIDGNSTFWEFSTPLALNPAKTLWGFRFEDVDPALNWNARGFTIFAATVSDGSAPNVPPIADAGPDQAVEDTDQTGSEDVTLDGSGSSDSDGTIVSYVWEEDSSQIGTGVGPTLSFTVAAHTVDLTVTDDDTATDSDSVLITVTDPAVNTPPTADAGPDQTVEDTDDNGNEDVTLDGSGSDDVDGTIVSYEWEEDSVPIATGVGPTVSFTVAAHTVDLIVTDDDTDTGTDSVLITVDPPVQTGVYYVDQSHPSASDGNPGTPALPWLTIDHAVGSVTAGETIYVKAGIYREYIKMVVSGTSGDPITLAAFGSDRAVISGAGELTGWTQCDLTTAKGNPDYASIYYVDIAWKPLSVHQDNVELAKAASPDLGWWPVDAASASTITCSALTEDNDYWNGAELFIWRVSATQWWLANITDFNAATDTLTYDSLGFLPSAADRFMLLGLVELINDPGEWGVEDIGGGLFRVYAWAVGGGDPGSYLMEAPDPSITTRHLVELYDESYWVIDGFEIRHNSGHGIGSYTGATPTAGFNIVQNCSIHHNEGAGVYERYTDGSIYRRNYVGYNGGLDGGTGINLINPCTNILIEESEIAFNTQDGITVQGDLITVRRNYIHDQWYFGHADNLQTSGTSTDVLIEDNFIWHSDQAYMISDMTGLTLDGNVAGGTAGNSVIFSDQDLTLTSNTLTCSGYGPVNASPASNDIFDFSDNIFMSGHYYRAFAMNSSNTFTSDYNLFWFGEGIGEMDETVVIWDSDFASRGLLEYQTESGKDPNSLFGDPLFVNAPRYYCKVDAPRQLEFTTTRVYLDAINMPHFAVGDNIEFDCDGVVRTITAKGADYVDFSPASEQVMFKCLVIANWLTATDYTLDFTPDTGSPALGNGSGGGNIGASINTVQFGIGDFTGDDVRDIPDWPENPNP